MSRSRLAKASRYRETMRRARLLCGFLMLGVIMSIGVSGAQKYSDAEMAQYEKSFDGYCETVEDFLDCRPHQTLGNNTESESILLKWGTEQGLKGLDGDIPIDQRRKALDSVYGLIMRKYIPDVTVADKAPDAGVKVQIGKPVVVMWAPEGKTSDRAGNIAKLGHLGPSLAVEGRWGQFMFPSIYKLRDGQLLVRVAVGGDGYPKEYLYYASGDAGKHWRNYACYDDTTEKPATEIALRLPDGEELRCLEPLTGRKIDVSGLNLKSYSGYYRVGDLPKEMQGVTMFVRKPGVEGWVEEKTYWDPDFLFKDGQELPSPLTMHWMTENHVMRDGSLLSTVFKGLPMLSELRPDGKLEQRPHPILRSYDRGRTWKVDGDIPGANVFPFYYSDLKYMTVRAHLLEFPNGNWVAAFRHPGLYWSGGGPLIVRTSSDQGKRWSEPKAIRMPGVNPLGLMLENGIAVFSYNRPGVFLTFCADGKGDLWGNDVTLVKPWRHARNETSCCNGCFLATGPDRFMYVYTKWDVTDPWGQPRQAVLAQEFVVTKK